MPRVIGEQNKILLQSQMDQMKDMFNNIISARHRLGNWQNLAEELADDDVAAAGFHADGRIEEEVAAEPRASIIATTPRFAVRKYMNDF